ncbi:MAG: 5-oxoprolinase subunit PxpA [Zoogloea sp.]|nr:5-oxoprolinase subunit PxpA [Zoogloea sp.]
MTSIDLNADLGEGCGDDAALLALVTSANIACGGHAGDAASMLATVRAAQQHGVAIGAHPAYPDRENFGRLDMDLPPDELQASIESQIRALAVIVEQAGASLSHVKPHGALYNRAARDAAVGAVVIDAVRAVDVRLALVVLAGSPLAAQARAAGLGVIEEAFPDRGYRADGSLVPRSQPGALVEDAEEVLARSLEMVRAGRVRAVGGEWLAIRADTLCLHGDGPHALVFARRLRAGLEAAGVRVCASGSK